MPTVATTRPSWSRTGAASDQEPSDISSLAIAQPRTRTAASSRTSRPGSVIV